MTAAAGRRLVEAVDRRTGSGLSYVGDAEHGETSGAAFVVWPDGRPGVVTRSTIACRAMRRSADVLNAARAAGLPVPRHDLVVEVDLDGQPVVAVVQERLPGRPPAYVDAALIDLVVAANDGFAGSLTGVDVPPLMLRSDARSPAHAVVRTHSARGARLAARIRQVAADGSPELIGDDLVHPDLTAPNVVLDDAGRVAGFVDWNAGVHRGDRHFALVKLLFDLTWDALGPDGGQQDVRPDAVPRLEAILRARVDAGRLRSYWAYWTLTMLHWTIRSGAPSAVVDLHLDLGERGLDLD